MRELSKANLLTNRFRAEHIIIIITYYITGVHKGSRVYNAFQWEKVSASIYSPIVTYDMFIHVVSM